MSNVIIDKSKIDILANAISDKSGVPVTMTLDEMVEAVDGIESNPAPTLQAKTYTVDSAGTETITADSGYDGLSSVAVSVPNADLAIGVSHGFYTSGGVIKWRVRGYADDDDDTLKGWFEGYQVGDYSSFNAIPANTTITPTESSQTIGGNQYMMEGAVTVSAIPSNYVGSGITRRDSTDLSAGGATVSVPSGYYASNASKSVSSLTLPNSASLTSSGTRKANILPSTASQYINIPTGYNNTAQFYDIVPYEVAPLSVTSNGTYNASDPQYDVSGFSTVTVNVSGGTSKNAQVVQSTTRTSASTLTAIGAELTVSKTGTYDIYYSCFRTNTSTSYTWATRLYINGTAYGTAENTTWTNNQQNTHLSNISLTTGDKLRVYGRNTRGTSYYVCAPMLAIVEA